MAAKRTRDNQGVGWTGGLDRYAGAITPSEEPSFSPALRGIRASGAGDVVVTLANDDVADAAKKVTIALTANVPETRYIIQKVWNAAAGTTATGIVGFY